MDTGHEAKDLASPGGWVVRAFGAPPVAWSRWYAGVCRRRREAVALGDESVLGGLDDYIPPNDAYVHDQLTSGSYGYDHFGNLVCVCARARAGASRRVGMALEGTAGPVPITDEDIRRRPGRAGPTTRGPAPAVCGRADGLCARGCGRA